MSIEINGVVYEDDAALKAKIDEVEQAKTALTGELTDIRPKLREKDDLIKTLQDSLTEATKKNVEAPTEEEKIARIVAGVLSQKDVETAKNNQKSAFDKFVNEHKEFHPDNDPAGIKRAALERELNGLTAWVTPSTSEDFAAVIGKANALLRGPDTPRQTNTGTQSSMAPSYSAPANIPDDKLSSKERDLIERNGFTEEKYLSLKAKMPDYIEGLLEQMR